MNASHSLHQGCYTRVGGHVGIVRDTGDVGDNGSSRLVLEPLFIGALFEPITINNTNWPAEFLTPEQLIDILICFSFLASQIGEVLKHSQSASPGTPGLTLGLRHAYELTSNSHAIFRETMARLGIAEGSASREVAFHRLFGVSHQDASAQSA